MLGKKTTLCPVSIVGLYIDKLVQVQRCRSSPSPPRSKTSSPTQEGLESEDEGDSSDLDGDHSPTPKRPNTKRHQVIGDLNDLQGPEKLESQSQEASRNLDHLPTQERLQSKGQGASDKSDSEAAKDTHQACADGPEVEGNSVDPPPQCLFCLKYFVGRAPLAQHYRRMHPVTAT